MKNFLAGKSMRPYNRVIRQILTQALACKLSNKSKIFVFVIYFFIILIPLPCEENNINAENTFLSDFYLIPVLETAFYKNIFFRPDWPFDIPPDSFMVSANDKRFDSIEIYNEDISYIVKYDNIGRLIEFPHFFQGKYAVIKVEYSENGSVTDINILLYEGESQNIKDYKITFPVDFLPYSDFSPGGSFPPVTVTLDDKTFYVFIFETISFLTETWYDNDGNMLVFCKAVIEQIEKSWRVRSFQSHT